MKLLPRILMLSVVLTAPVALHAQRGGGNRSRGELQIGGSRGTRREEGRRSVGTAGIPFYSAVPFYPYYPYISTVNTPSNLSTFYLPLSNTIYPQSSDVPTPVPQPSTAEDVHALETQIQALSAEVQRLQSSPSPRIAPPQEAPPVLPSTTLVFRDSHRVEIRNYAIVDQTLRVLDKDNASRIALSDLDLDATRKVNQENGVRFLVR